MLEHIKTVLNRCGLAATSRAILVGVSGGPDSLCLATLLHDLGYPVIIAHLDHQLRAESGAEAENVRRFAGELGAPFFLEKADVYALQEESRASLEEAARLARYRFLFRVAKENQAQAVAVGHNANDQVETFLMHLLRGAGLSGLKGMAYCSLPNPWSSEIPLIRPLLGCWREEIVEFIQQRELTPNLDASNQDNRYLRNRIRNEMLPYLEAYNPQIRQSIWQASELLYQDYEALDTFIQEAWNECVQQSGEHYLAFELPALQARPAAIQRHLILRGLRFIQPASREIDFDAVNRIIAFLSHPSRSRRLDVVANIQLLQEGQRLWLAEEEAGLPGDLWPQLETASSYLELNVPGEAGLPEGWRLRTEFVSPAGILPEIQANDDPFQAWLEADALRLPLQVRARRAGDRFAPLGMEGRSQKVSDLMTNRRIPRRSRRCWPLVCAGDRIVWIPGMGTAHECRLSEGTKMAVHLQVLKPEETAS